MIADRQIHNAAQHPVPLDMAQVDAVEARILLDLRIGAAMSRLQTLSLQRRFPDHDLSEDVISYGTLSCSYIDFSTMAVQGHVSSRPSGSLCLGITK